MNKVKSISLEVLIISVMLILLGFAFLDLRNQAFDLFFDRLFMIAIIIAYYFFNLKYSFPTHYTYLALIPIVLHSSKLYGHSYLGIQFDFYHHFFSCFVIGLLVNYILFKKNPENKLQNFVLAVLIVAGIGSLFEIMEFGGYALFGKGEGVFRYGLGDFGELNDTIWDMVNNTLGAIFASLLYVGKKVKKLKDRNLISKY